MLEKSINVMLKNIIGNYSINKLQIIQIFEADFNINNKWLDKSTMSQAKLHHLLVDEQYVSQKSKLL